MLRKHLLGSLTALAILSSPFSLHAQSSPLTVQPSTGRVGIGTTTPNSALEVKGSSVGISVMNNAGSMNYYLGINDGDSNKLYIGRGRDPSLGIAPAITVTTGDVVSMGARHGTVLIDWTKSVERSR